MRRLRPGVAYAFVNRARKRYCLHAYRRAGAPQFHIDRSRERRPKPSEMAAWSKSQVMRKNPARGRITCRSGKPLRTARAVARGGIFALGKRNTATTYKIIYRGIMKERSVLQQLRDDYLPGPIGTVIFLIICGIVGYPIAFGNDLLMQILLVLIIGAVIWFPFSMGGD